MASPHNPAPAPAPPSLEAVCALEGHEDRVWCVAFAPCGSVLASCGGDSAVRLWTRSSDDGSWSSAGALDGVHSRTVRCVAWSPSGKLLASCSFDGTTAVWARADGAEMECVATLEGHENEVKAVAWSPSGQLLATCSRDKSVWVWEAAEAGEFECVSVLHGHSQDVKSVRWHPDGASLVSASYDNTLRVWTEDEDDADWVGTDTLDGHASTVWALAFDRAGARMATCSDDCSVALWRRGPAPDHKWARQSALQDAHTRTIFAVDWFRGEGAGEGAPLATCGADDAVRVWRVQPAPEAGAPETLGAVCAREAAHRGDVNCVAWAPASEEASDGRRTYTLATAGDDMAVRLWSVTM